MDDQAVYSLAIQALEERRDRVVSLSAKSALDCDKAIERLLAMKELNQFLAGFFKCNDDILK